MFYNLGTIPTFSIQLIPCRIEQIINMQEQIHFMHDKTIIIID